MIIRPAWARMKAENHPFYVNCKLEGMKDGTPSPRYASGGRWACYAGLMSGEEVFFQKAWAQFSLVPFATKPLMISNNLRESGTENLSTLAYLKSHITPAQYTEARDFYIRTADNAIADGIRTNDSDQLTGTYFYLRAMELHGLDYQEKVIRNLTDTGIPLKVKDLLEYINKFCSVLAEGGSWIESSGYNPGTVFLIFNGAEVNGGIDKFPEILKFRDAHAKFLIHQFVPNLKDMHEWGDEQEPHDVQWISLESDLAYLSNFYPEVNQFEDDLRKVHPTKLPDKPFYARYFFWKDPYAPKKDWKNWVGNFHVAPGAGLVHARSGWKDTDSSIMVQFPSFSRGEVDHVYGWFGDFTIFDNGKWTLDKIRAYNGAPVLGNQAFFFGLGAPKEVGTIVATKHIEGKLAYVSGVNAGCHEGIKRLVVDTLLHENKRSVFHFWDRKITVVIDRIHITLPTEAQIARYPDTVEAVIRANPPIQTIWHSRLAAPPIVTGNKIQADSLITLYYPATLTVVNEVNLGGTIAPTEKKHHVKCVPTTVKEFQIQVTVIGVHDSCVVNQDDDNHNVIVKKTGFPDIRIVSSNKPGPKLVTSTVKNSSGGLGIEHDPKKLDSILPAHDLVNEVSSFTGDTFIEKSRELTVVGESGGETDAVQKGIDRIRTEIDILERINKESL